MGTWRLQAIGILTLEPERLKNRFHRGSVLSGHLAPTGHRDTHSRTRASQEPIDHHPRKNCRRWTEVLTRDAQAACGFSFSTSKFSPFFHSVRVMAAILRASVRRTMVGLIPLATERW